MNTKRAVTVIFAVLVVAMLAGETMIYVANPYDYSSDVTEGEDGISYTVESSMAADFTVVQTVRGDFHPIDRVYVYCDTRYGAMNAAPDEGPAEDVVKELAFRGTDSELIDADSLRELFLNGDAEGTAVVFTYGALPSTVYSADGDDPLFDWFGRGGSVYWFGTTIGRYIATDDGEAHSVEGYEDLFFGAGNMSYSMEDRIGSVQSEMAEAFCIRAADARFGVSASIPDSLEVGYVTEDGFSSASLVKFGNGMLGIVSGVFDNASRGSFAQMIASGLTYQSGLAAVEHEHVRGGSASGTLNDIPMTQVYVFAGGYYTCYGALYRLD